MPKSEQTEQRGIELVMMNTTQTNLQGRLACEEVEVRVVSVAVLQPRVCSVIQIGHHLIIVVIRV